MSNEKGTGKDSNVVLSWLTLAVICMLSILMFMMALQINQIRKYLPEFAQAIQEQISENGQSSCSNQSPETIEFEGVVNIENAPKTGNRTNPKIIILEFSDFQCPYCSGSLSVISEILDKHPDEILLVHLDFPLPFHESATGAALVANCAGEQGKYWEIRDLLYNGQSDLSLETNIARAKSIGVDEDTFTECLSSQAMAYRIEEDFAIGEEIGIKGTPSFLISNNFDITNLSAFEIEGTVVFLNQLSGSVEALIED